MKPTEQLARLSAYNSLIALTRLTFKAYRPGWHHKLIAGALERASTVDGSRIIITMPPRHGKTELASIRYAPWILARRPSVSVIAATYAQDYADELGRKARAVVASPVYTALFPHAGLSGDNRAVSRWRTRSGGSYYGVGVGGPLTGRGADILLIDDPHKNREEAESQIARDRVWDWFRSTAYTRLEKGGSVVLIMTRWHEDDLVARCLATGEPWEVLSLPALAEQDEEYRKRGEALWPEKYTVDALEQIHRTVGDREWDALYQQHPTSLEGGLFKPDRLVTIDAEPHGMEWVRAWDFGATAGGGDWSAGVKLGVKDGRPVIADVVRLRGSPDEVEAALLSTAARDGRNVRVCIPQDPGQAGKSQVQYLTRQLAGYPVKSSPESGNKALRAEPFASQVNVGNVSMVRAHWNMALVDEMRAFPNGVHDDQVDALSRAYSEYVAPSTTAILEYLRGLRDVHANRQEFVTHGAT